MECCYDMCCARTWSLLCSHSWMHSDVWEAADDHGPVRIMRVDDETEVVADRNWPSGVLRPVALAYESTSEQQEQRSGITLLQVHAASKATQSPCLSAGGHLEPLVTAAAVFNHCAGVSHPLFPGRPSVWIPFLPHCAAGHFATPFYDGLINFGLESVQWARPPLNTALLSQGELPFAERATRAVIRAGSVVKCRVTREAADDSQATVSDASGLCDGDQTHVELMGLVLLTYIRLSDTYTQHWRDLCLPSFPAEADKAAIHTFCAEFPRTPVACLVVVPLDGIDVVSTRIHTSVNVCDVIQVIPPDPSNALWGQWKTRSVQHMVSCMAKPATSRSRAKSKIVQQVQTVQLAKLRVNKLVEDQYANPNSLFAEWFRSLLVEVRSDASANTTRSLHSFYHDVAAGAQCGIQQEKVDLLMEVRRLINVPQKQPKLSEEVAEPVPLVLPSPRRSAEQPPQAQTSGARAQADSASTEQPRPVPALPDSRRMLRENPKSRDLEAISPQEMAELIFWFFCKLAEVDVPEDGAPFAALLSLSTSALTALVSTKRFTVGKKFLMPAYAVFGKEDPQGVAILQTHATTWYRDPSNTKAKRTLTADLREKVCAELAMHAAASPAARACVWRAHKGVRPAMGSETFLARSAAGNQQQQQQQSQQQHPQRQQQQQPHQLRAADVPSAGVPFFPPGPLMLPVSAYLTHAQLSSAPAAAPAPSKSPEIVASELALAEVARARAEFHKEMHKWQAERAMEAKARQQRDTAPSTAPHSAGGPAGRRAALQPNNSTGSHVSQKRTRNSGSKASTSSAPTSASTSSQRDDRLKKRHALNKKNLMPKFAVSNKEPIEEQADDEAEEAGEDPQEEEEQSPAARPAAKKIKLAPAASRRKVDSKSQTSETSQILALMRDQKSSFESFNSRLDQRDAKDQVRDQQDQLQREESAKLHKKVDEALSKVQEIERQWAHTGYQYALPPGQQNYYQLPAGISAAPSQGQLALTALASAPSAASAAAHSHAVRVPFAWQTAPTPAYVHAHAPLHARPAAVPHMMAELVNPTGGISEPIPGYLYNQAQMHQQTTPHPTQTFVQQSQPQTQGPLIVFRVAT